MRNRYSLAAMARSRNVRRKSLKLRPIITPRSFEVSAAKICSALAEEWRMCVEELILPAYERSLVSLNRDSATFADADYLKLAFQATTARVTKVVANLVPKLKAWSVRVEAWQRRKFLAGIAASLGEDRFPYISYAEAAPTIDASLQRFASLITNVSDTAKKRVEETVWRELLNQTPRREIGAQIAGQLDIERRRANFIAKDQTLKMAGKLNQVRQQQAGIEKYIWCTAGDDRVRESHAEKEGKVFSWNNPPEDTGHPGEDINCRCTAQAYIDLMGESDDD